MADLFWIIVLRAYALGAIIAIWLWQRRATASAYALGVAFILLAAIGCWVWWVNDAEPQQAKTEPSTETYRVYLPAILNVPYGNEPSMKKGVSSPWSCRDVETLRVSWFYNWSMSANVDCPGLEFVPMIWGRNEANALLANPNPRIGNGIPILLFNEPDLGGQANLSASEAVALAHELFLRYPNARWISPAPSQLNPGWLSEWRGSYVEAYGEPPPIAGIALHCYSQLAQPCIDYTRGMVEWAWSWGVGEVWVTEFAFIMGMDRTFAEATDELRKFLDYAESEPMITRYAPYTTRLAGDEFEWGSPDYANIAPLLTYRRGARTPWGRTYAGY